jgi:hypothetical protein
MGEFYKTLTQVRLNAQLRQLIAAIDRYKEDYKMAGRLANDYSTEGKNWRELQRSAFRDMQAHGDRIMELVAEFFQQQRG